MRPSADLLQDFADRLAGAFESGVFVKAVLARYRGAEPELTRVNLRRVELRDGPRLQFVYRHTTKDVTRNHGLDEALVLVRSLLGVQGFRCAHLHTTEGLDELTITQRGQVHLRRLEQPATPAVAPEQQAHNLEKQRPVPLGRPYLRELGVTTAEGQLVPAMARKWRQINKFVEVFAGALAASTLADAKALRIVDFGSGKGYLTFAIHDWLAQARGVAADVIGVELRPDMVRLCNAVVERLGLNGLHFELGDVRSWAPRELDVMIALHACDTATDHAIHLGLRGGARIILCAPCCHKQIRPQLLSPHPLRPILKHGVHLGQEAEMLTDGLRALLLESAGYDTQVFEFVSLEHTSKNKMILAVRRAQPSPSAPVREQIEQIKAFYGIREHCLERLIDTTPPG